MSQVNQRFTKEIPSWKTKVTGLRQSVYFTFPIYEMRLSAENLSFSKEFREDLRICRYLELQTLRNEYFKYIISKYGFFWPGECVYHLGGYIELEYELVLQEELSFREATLMMQILIKKYLRNLLVAYKESPTKQIKGAMLGKILTELEADDFGYLFTRRIKSLNGKSGKWDNIGKMIREIRNLGPECQIIKIHHPAFTNNSSQFFLNLKPPKTPKELKAEEELDKRMKLRSKN
jgi:hypothetical protein